MPGLRVLYPGSGAEYGTFSEDSSSENEVHFGRYDQIHLSASVRFIPAFLKLASLITLF